MFLRDRVDRMVQQLCREGVKPGDRIPQTEAKLTLPWLIRYLALGKLGALSMISTSGTTGEPKWAVHGSEQFLESARVVNAALGVTQESRVWLNLPVNHVGGLAWVWRGMISGATIVVSSTLPEGITHLSWVPTQLVRALQQPEMWDRLRQIQVIYLGGAGVDESVLQRAWDLGLKVWPVYGMTEMTSSIAIRKVGEPGATVLPGRDLILDAQGQVRVKGESLFQGYVDASGVCCLPLDEHGYFETRDVGVFEDGFLKILGRLDDLIISGGKNIWPSEIEAALLKLPGIVLARVESCPDFEFGQRPLAYVEMADGSDPNSEAIRAQLREFLPGYKLPVRILNRI